MYQYEMETANLITSAEQLPLQFSSEISGIFLSSLFLRSAAMFFVPKFNTLV